MKLSICFVNTNNKNMLERGLNSVFQYPPDAPYEVLVVDNVSTDGSADMVREKFPQVILTENRNRLGYPSNCNINMRKAQGDYYLLLNEDIEILPDSLDIGLAYMDSHPEVGILGCSMLYPDGGIMFTSGRMFPTMLNDLLGWTTLSVRFPNSRFFGRYHMSYWAHDTIREVDTVQEAGILARRQAVNDVGMLDENLFFNCDGPDWTQRFWRAGQKVVYHPGVRITHYHGQSSQPGGKQNLFLLFESLRSRQYYYKKYHGNLYAFIYRLVMISMFFALTTKHTIAILSTRKNEKMASLKIRRKTALVQLVWYLGGTQMIKLLNLV